MKKKNSLFASCILSAFLFTAATASLSLEVNAEEQNPKRIEVTAGTEDAITNALKDAVSGDTLIIHAGEYKEQICITTPNLTIKAEEGAILNGEDISLENESEVKSDSMVYIEADNVSISGLEIKGLKLHHISKKIAPKGIYVAEGSDDVSITNCTIHDMGIAEYDPAFNKETDSYNAHGILAEAQPYNPIKNLKIKKCTLYNLTLGNSEALVVNGNVEKFEISGNYIHNCDNIGIDAIGYEQTTDEDSAEKVELDRAHDGRIFENIVKNNSSETNITYDYEGCAAGIYIDGGRDIWVFDNFVSNCDTGIEVATEHLGKTVTGIKVTNNTLIENNGLAGIIIGGSDPSENGDAKSCIFFNNTVYNTAGSCLTVQLAKDPSNVVKNNLFICKDEAEIYYADEESYGTLNKDVPDNSITGNMFNEDISEEHAEVMDNNKTFEFKKISIPSNKTKDTTVIIEASENIQGFGSTGTHIK